MRKLSVKQLNRVSPENFKKMTKTPVCIILDNVRSALNVGSAFRTADGFGIAGIDLCGITAQPPHRDIQKTALGSQEVINWAYFENTLTCVEQRKKEGYQIMCIEQVEGSLPLNLWIPAVENEPSTQSTKYAFVFGNEVKGVSQHVVDAANNCLEIPQFGTKHSLNISVSVGIILWHYQNEMLKRR